MFLLSLDVSKEIPSTLQKSLTKHKMQSSTTEKKYKDVVTTHMANVETIHIQLNATHGDAYG